MQNKELLKSQKLQIGFTQQLIHIGLFLVQITHIPFLIMVRLLMEYHILIGRQLLLLEPGTAVKM